MRPVRIRLGGFGAFVDEQVLDLSELEEIFLVSGRTGSGKTTIFDAIVYALYGRVPGTRSEEDVRSNFIDDDRETTVELEFLLHGRRYKVERGVKVSRPKSNPDEVRLHKRAAFYELEGGSYVPMQELKTPTAVSAHISDLLHLSSDEFSKIILLPQGEFQKFLEDDSRGRQVILEKLFPTERHKRVTEALRERKNEIQREMKSLVEQIELLEMRFDTKTYTQRAASLEKQMETERGEISRHEADLARANQKLAKEEGLLENYQKLDSLTERGGELEEEKSTIEELKRALDLALKADTLMPEVIRLDGEIAVLEDQEGQRTACAGQLEETSRELEGVQEKAKAIPEMQEQVSRIDGEIGKLEPLVEKERELGRVRDDEENTEQAWRDAMSALDSVNRELKEAAGSIADKKKRIKILEKDEAAYPKALNELKGAETLHELSEKYEKHKGEKENLGRSLAQLEETQTGKKSELENSERDLKKLRERKESSLAATLSATLEKGKPCPVCGSTEHPHPAVLEIAAFEDDELLVQIEEKVRGFIGEISSLKSEIKSTSEQRAKIEGELTKLEAGHPLPLAEAEKEVREKVAEVRFLEASREELKRARMDLEKLESDREELERTRDEAQKVHGERDKALGSLKTEVKRLEQDLQGLSDVESTIRRKTEEAKDLRKKIEDIQSREKALRESRVELDERLKQITQSCEKKAGEIDALRGEIDRKTAERGFKNIEEVRSAVIPERDKDAAEERIDSYTAEVRDVDAQRRQLSETIGDQPRPDVEGRKAMIAQLEGAKKDHEVKKDSLTGELQDLERDRKEHGRLHASLGKLKTESKIVVELADDLSGNNEKRINFQNFVLHSYLRQVTAFASRRLKIMSEGRYDILVSEDTIDLRKQGGLELQVMDAYTGVKRSVRTLSGGEKFMASISLALGLADAIQSRAGQVEMDAIFIDEGFGTLDDSALDHALTILDDIRENRMVGVISHVSELRNRIPCQVRVEKSVEGSRITVL